MNEKYICVHIVNGKFEVSAGILEENIYYIHNRIFAWKNISKMYTLQCITSRSEKI